MNAYDKWNNFDEKAALDNVEARLEYSDFVSRLSKCRSKISQYLVESSYLFKNRLESVESKVQNIRQSES